MVNASNLISFFFGVAVLWVFQKMTGKLIPAFWRKKDEIA